MKNSAARKNKTNKLLEEFYGLILDASTYLNCPDSNAANVIMIEIPDRLATFLKVCQNREVLEEARTTGIPTTTAACNLKLHSSERGPLFYIAGYIVSKLHQKSRKSKNECDEELHILL